MCKTMESVAGKYVFFSVTVGIKGLGIVIGRRPQTGHSPVCRVHFCTGGCVV
jgi:hypothetical protein